MASERKFIASLARLCYTRQEAGLEAVDAVTEAVFAYIALVRAEGVQGWIHDERRILRDLSFRFQDKQEPVKCVPWPLALLLDYLLLFFFWGGVCPVSFLSRLLGYLVTWTRKRRRLLT